MDHLLLMSCTTGDFDSLVFVESVSDISASPSSHLQGLHTPLVLHFLPQERGKSICGSALSFHKCGSSSSCLHPAHVSVTFLMRGCSYNSSGMDKQQRERWGQPQSSAVSCSRVSCPSWALGSQICHLQVPAAQPGSCTAPHGPRGEGCWA